MGKLYILSLQMFQLQIILILCEVQQYPYFIKGNNENTLLVNNNRIQTLQYFINIYDEKLYEQYYSNLSTNSENTDSKPTITFSHKFSKIKLFKYQDKQILIYFTSKQVIFTCSDNIFLHMKQFSNIKSLSRSLILEIIQIDDSKYLLIIEKNTNIFRKIDFIDLCKVRSFNQLQYYNITNKFEIKSQFLQQLLQKNKQKWYNTYAYYDKQFSTLILFSNNYIMVFEQNSISIIKEVIVLNGTQLNISETTIVPNNLNLLLLYYNENIYTVKENKLRQLLQNVSYFQCMNNYFLYMSKNNYYFVKIQQLNDLENYISQKQQLLNLSKMQFYDQCAKSIHVETIDDDIILFCINSNKIVTMDLKQYVYIGDDRYLDLLKIEKMFDYDNKLITQIAKQTQIALFANLDQDVFILYMQEEINNISQRESYTYKQLIQIIYLIFIFIIFIICTFIWILIYIPENCGIQIGKQSNMQRVQLLTCKKQEITNQLRNYEVDLQDKLIAKYKEKLSIIYDDTIQQPNSQNPTYFINE